MTTPGSPPDLPKRPGTAMPASADSGRRCRSDTEALPFHVDEAGRPHLDQYVTAAHRVIGAYDLAMPLRPAREQAEAEPMAERGRKCDRGDIALVVLGGGLSVLGNEMSARAQAVFPVERPQAHERRTRGIGERGPRRHEASDEVLLGREQLAKAEIVRRGLAVQLAPRWMPFLDAQDAERLGAIRRDAEGRARFQDRAHQTVAEARRYADLVGQLAREGEAVDPRPRAAAHGDLAT